jgi:hypothetical protein
MLTLILRDVSAKIGRSVGPEAVMYDTSYRHVEAALMRAYGVPDKASGAFRSRLGNLQKQGLLGRHNMPGRGAALRYGPDQFHRLVLACELFEFGASPATILGLIESRWEKTLAPIFKKAERAAEHDDAGPGDIIMHMGGARLMTEAWSDAVPNVNSCTLADLPKQIDLWMRDRRLPARALIVNLSSRLRRFHAALADLHFAEMEREKAGAKVRK